jgi:hypothetical protein
MRKHVVARRPHLPATRPGLPTVAGDHLYFDDDVAPPETVSVRRRESLLRVGLARDRDTSRRLDSARHNVFPFAPQTTLATPGGE